MRRNYQVDEGEPPMSVAARSRAGEPDAPQRVFFGMNVRTPILMISPWERSTVRVLPAGPSIVAKKWNALRSVPVPLLEDLSGSFVPTNVPGF
jgi:hypothetical protein